MKRIVILGAGTGGTVVANQLRRRFPEHEASIQMLDRDAVHLYQPGLLLLPFGKYRREDLLRPRGEFVAKGVDFRIAEVDRVETDANRVRLADGTAVPYDVLIIATGSRIVAEETPGLLGSGWRKTIHEFYTLEGSEALGAALQAWPGGRLVVHIKEMPIKCPVAPLEFSFLADSYFRERGMRDKVDIRYVTPLPGAFTRPIASDRLGSLLQDRGIALVPEFDVERIDPDARQIVSYDGRTVPYDLLVEIPTHMGDALVDRSGMGDELGFVPTHAKTLQSKAHGNVFVIGDATDIATSKAGSVAHFEAEVLVENVARYLSGRPLQATYDGHSNCFVETGGGKGLLIDFSMEVEPLPGKFPFPGIGPLSLLRESRLNHWGKLAFRWVYWNLLLPGRRIPFVHSHLSMTGKELPPTKAA
jgi:sulfide:quinone oxidoreductase